MNKIRKMSLAEESKFIEIERYLLHNLDSILKLPNECYLKSLSIEIESQQNKSHLIQMKEENNKFYIVINNIFTDKINNAKQKLFLLLYKQKELKNAN